MAVILKSLYLLLQRAKLLVNHELLLEACTSSTLTRTAIISPAVIRLIIVLILRAVLRLSLNPNCSHP